MRAAGFIGMAALLALGACGSSSSSSGAGDVVSDATGAPNPDTDRYLAVNKVLVANACSNCHAADYARVGPAMTDIATVLEGKTATDRARLRDSILNGSKGKWGEAIMPAQRQVTPEKVDAIVDAILSTPPNSAAQPR